MGYGHTESTKDSSADTRVSTLLMFCVKPNCLSVTPFISEIITSIDTKFGIKVEPVNPIEYSGGAEFYVEFKRW